MKKRILYYDNIRYLAAIIVFTWHFIRRFSPSLFWYWSNGVSHYFLQGITGKFGVVVFCVVLGYFAGKSGRKNGGGTLFHYILSRYIQFVLMGVFVNSLYLCVNLFNVFPDKSITIMQVIKSSILLGEDIFPAFWCMKVFLLGGTICYANKKYEISPIVCLFEMLIFIFIGRNIYYDGIWITFCIMGSFMDELNDNQYLQPLLKNQFFQYGILVLIFILFKRPLCQKTFLIQAGCMVAFFLVLRNNERLAAFCGNTTLAKVGNSYMGFYLVHLVSYNVVCMLLYGYQERLTGLHFCIVYVVSLIVCVTAGYYVNKLLTATSAKVERKIFCLLGRE